MRLARDGYDDRSLNTSFVAVLILLLLFSAAAWWQSAKLFADSDDVNRSRQALVSVQSLRNNMLLAGSDQRAYLISGKVEYLNLYRSSLRDASAALAELRQETGDRPREAKAAGSLTSIVGRYTDVMNAPLRSLPKRVVSDASFAAAADTSKRLMRQILDSCGTLELSATRLLSQQLAATRQGSRLTVGCVLAVGLIGICTLTGLFYAAKKMQALKNVSIEIERRHGMEMERKVRERTAELEQTNSSLEEFNYSIAHDLRSPLRSINATASILLSEAAGRLTDEEQAMLRRQAEAATHLGRVIDELLKLAKLNFEPLLAEPLDLSKLFCGVGEALQTQTWPAGHDVLIQSGIAAIGDPALLRLVAYVLMENAFKYSPDGGQVRFYANEMDGNTSYTVADEGVGFDMAEAESNLFRPFHRLHRSDEFEGNGIGLANAKRIIERHGGHIWANSEKGKGTKVSFTLGPGRLSEHPAL